jgi:hypothetical protein
MQFNGRGFFMNVKLVSIVAGVAMLGGVSQASAAIMDVTYTGWVTSGTDTLGVFGGGSLVGLSWVATYTFDTTLGYWYSSSNYNEAWGGYSKGAGHPSPVLSSMITINGVGRAVDGSYFGQDLGYNFDYNNERIFSRQNHMAENYNYGHHEYLEHSIYNYIGLLPASITTPFTYTVNGSDNASGEYYLWKGTIPERISAHLATLTVSDHVAAVPEPSTWAMMLLGFAGVGFAAYRKKKTGTFAMTAA